VATKEPLIPFSMYDVDNDVIADIESIRKCNPQRFEIEQLTAVVFEDFEQRTIVGYVDTSLEDFWVRGHMPGMPLMPGVLMCEAAAQLASYFVQKNDILGCEMVGFGGLDNVRFRGAVRPGDRLVIQCKQKRARRGALVLCDFMGFVNENLVVEGSIRGIPLPADALREVSPS
jgi:3-hydroxyacyl-[acyl-carrier-protein] dehydratase|tara:strand:- start:22 stop:540 length:519 start_codon:yes stop_codon:yes gene_type:complete